MEMRLGSHGAVGREGTVDARRPRGKVRCSNLVAFLVICCVVLPSLSSPSAPSKATQHVRTPNKLPPGWGGLVTVGGSAYLNWSTSSVQCLEKVMDLPECLHEGAEGFLGKKKKDWRLSSRIKPSKLGFISSLLPQFPSPIPLRGVPLTNTRPNRRVFLSPTALVQPLAHGRAFREGVSIWSSKGGGMGFGAPKKGDADKGKGTEEGDRGISGLRKGGNVREVEMHFTCNKCETRQAKRFTRDAYERGVVIIQCSGCEAKHLIADHFGWYKDWTDELGITVEEMIKRKGGKLDNRLLPWDPDSKTPQNPQAVNPEDYSYKTSADKTLEILPDSD